MKKLFVLQLLFTLTIQSSVFNKEIAVIRLCDKGKTTQLAKAIKDNPTAVLSLIINQNFGLIEEDVPNLLRYFARDKNEDKNENNNGFFYNTIPKDEVKKVFPEMDIFDKYTNLRTMKLELFFKVLKLNFNDNELTSIISNMSQNQYDYSLLCCAIKNDNLRIARLLEDNGAKFVGKDLRYKKKQLNSYKKKLDKYNTKLNISNTKNLGLICIDYFTGDQNSNY